MSFLTLLNRHCCIWFLVLLAIGLPRCVYAQNDDEQLIQFSGIVMTSDSLLGIPFAHIINKTTGHGTISNYEGVFSFVAHPGDTILFSALGFKRETFVIPADLEDDKYSVIQLLTRDTVYLPETLIYPWPTPEQFKEAFLKLDLPDDDLARARKNLERETLKELGIAMEMDAAENRDYYLRKEAEKFSYNGQVPPMNIFNPLAWAQFIEAWKRGEFRRKK